MKYTINTPTKKFSPYADSEVKEHTEKEKSAAHGSSKNTPSEIIKAVRSGKADITKNLLGSGPRIKTMQAGGDSIKELAEQIRKIKKEHPGAEVHFATVDETTELGKKLHEHIKNGGSMEDITPNSELGKLIMQEQAKGKTKLPTDILDMLDEADKTDLSKGGEHDWAKTGKKVGNKEEIDAIQKEDDRLYGQMKPGEYNVDRRIVIQSFGITDERANELLDRSFEILLETQTGGGVAKAIEECPLFADFRERAFALMHIENQREFMFKDDGTMRSKIMMKKALRELQEDRDKIKKEKEDLEQKINETDTNSKVRRGRKPAASK